MNKPEQTKKKILETFEDNSASHWKTISELQGATGSTANEITKVINQSADFVQSSKVIDGENLYTTRKAFKNNESFFSKVIGAFKNRID